MNALHSWTRYLINHFVDKMVAVSNAVKEQLIKCGVPAEKIEVLYSILDPDQFQLDSLNKSEIRINLGISNDSIVIGTAGKLNPGKGIFPLLTAVHQVSKNQPKIKLLFVGDGPSRDQLEQEAQQLSLQDDVIITGFREDMNRMYAVIDIFILPSICQEAFGMVLVEAMAMGKPVIGTAVGGIPEIIRHEINGLLVAPQDPDALATAIMRYLSDKDFSQTMATAAFNTVATIYSEETLKRRLNHMLG
jgi:glycosyltransferase involved in cell wall biosynthesis